MTIVDIDKGLNHSSLAYENVLLANLIIGISTYLGYALFLLNYEKETQQTNYINKLYLNSNRKNIGICSSKIAMKGV